MSGESQLGRKEGRKERREMSGTLHVHIWSWTTCWVSEHNMLYTWLLICITESHEIFETVSISPSWFQRTTLSRTALLLCKSLSTLTTSKGPYRFCNTPSTNRRASTVLVQSVGIVDSCSTRFFTARWRCRSEAGDRSVDSLKSLWMEHSHTFKDLQVAWCWAEELFLGTGSSLVCCWCFFSLWRSSQLEQWAENNSKADA